MVTIFNGRKRQEEIFHELRKEIDILKHEKIIPKLAIIDATNREASKIFIKQKISALERLGLMHELYELKEAIEEEILDLIERLNENENVNGILVQLPLPSNIDTDKIVNRIDPLKDVDGLTATNLGKLMHGDETLAPCTPKAIIDILQSSKIEVEGKNVTIINNSIVVGKPLAIMLTNRFATVTICHIKTENLKQFTLSSEILITATGVANLIKKDNVQEGAVVIDAGITRMNDKVVGDVEFDSVKEKCSLITPVPGGVGPMTVAMVVVNLINCTKMQLK